MVNIGVVSTALTNRDPICPRFTSRRRQDWADYLRLQNINDTVIATARKQSSLKVTSKLGGPINEALSGSSIDMVGAFGVSGIHYDGCGRISPESDRSMSRQAPL